MQDLIVRAESIARRLKDRGETVVVAESSTGGLISAALLALPGASAYFLGGAVVYTQVARRALLDLPDISALRMRASTEPYAGLLARAEPPGRAAIATAIRPATPASLWPVRSSAQPRSKPAAPTAWAICKPSAPLHSTCCWMCWPVNLRHRPDRTPVRQTAGKVTAKQLPCAAS